MSSREAIAAEIPRLRRYARALAGSAERADDLVQDTVERALLKWPLWRSGSDLRAWLFAIMHNLFVDQMRAPQAGVQAGAQFDDLHSEDPAPYVVQRATQDDRLALRDLERALALLPLEQREVLLLIGLEDLSYAQAAAALSVPIGTVMSRLARGRARLKSILSGELSAIMKVVK